MCHYHGKIRGIDHSWAAISTCNNRVSGVVFDGVEMHYIEKGAESNSPHYLYKHSDLNKQKLNKTCGFEGDAIVNYDDDILDFDQFSKHNRILRVIKMPLIYSLLRMLILANFQYKRSADAPQIRGPYNANKQSRYVELVLVADNREYKELGENVNRVEEHCKNIANIVNAVNSPDYIVD